MSMMSYEEKAPSELIVWHIGWTDIPKHGRTDGRTDKVIDSRQKTSARPADAKEASVDGPFFRSKVIISSRKGEE